MVLIPLSKTHKDDAIINPTIEFLVSLQHGISSPYPLKKYLLTTKLVRYHGTTIFNPQFAKFFLKVAHDSSHVDEAV